jgi:UDP-glucose 4-epimerase
MNILVTGGTGFIGSHTVVELINDGHEVIIIDDLSNSTENVLNGIEKITSKYPVFYKGDCADQDLLRIVFANHKIDGVIHFAAFKAVGESVEKPLKYYKNNVLSLLNLLEVMQEVNVKNIVFSSSCTVYGNPDAVPVTEETPRKKAESAYGQSKNICEDILEDVHRAKADLKMISLRYFNPIGAHESAEIGELPNGIPSNLVPYITQTAIGIRPQLSVFGDDYDTADGSNIRDFIHVVDLAKAHIAALKHLNTKTENHFYDVFNVGSGAGSSVLELIATFEKVNNIKLNYKIVERRAGDVVKIFGSVDKAAKILNWKVEKTLEDCLRDAWRWEQKLHINK